MTKRTLIGEVLLRSGVIDAHQLALALETQEKSGISFSDALVRSGVADEEILVEAIANSLHLDFFSANLPEISNSIAALLPADFCRKRLVIPLGVEGNALRLALTDPMDYATMQDVEFRTGKRVVAVVASRSHLQTLIQQTYPPGTPARVDTLGAEDPQVEVESSGELEIEVADPAKLAKDTQLVPVIRLVNLIFSGAANAGASDIHLEPKEAYLQVRYRVDGLLREALKVPRNQMDATISRIKIISGMDIADRRRPQDGRCRLKYEGKRIDLRVSTLPTQFGEKVVIRLLDGKRAQVGVEELGLTPENQHIFQLLLSRPQGIILVTGPTGSGKSSTLYTALNWVKSSTKNIITVEDPIEYQLDGVNQVQINTKAGVTFAAGLRSILRQDPNIILVGEIRDQETAGIALEAAQTGHLLLSTLHTNDAPGAITRLLDLGVEPFLIASAVIGILAQRLVRRPCSSCLVSRPPCADTIQKAGGAPQLPPSAKWVAGRGCEACRQSGSQGRIAIHELLTVNDEIRELISRRASEHAIRKAARNAGMSTLLEDGIRKAARGLTTLDDVVRVVAADDAATHKEEATKPQNFVPASSGDHGGEEKEKLQNSGNSPSQSEAAPELAVETGNSHLSSPLSREEHGLGQRRKERVLVVEDSSTIASVVKYFLELEGFEVATAKDGEEGLQAAQLQLPRVIVTDCHMPGMDGMTMVQGLRSDPRTRKIVVLMLTSESSVEKEAQALEAGVDDFILKPIEPRRLAARVKALLGRQEREHADILQ